MLTITQIQPPSSPQVIPTIHSTPESPPSPIVWYNHNFVLHRSPKPLVSGLKLEQSMMGECQMIGQSFYSHPPPCCVSWAWHLSHTSMLSERYKQVAHIELLLLHGAGSQVASLPWMGWWAWMSCSSFLGDSWLLGEVCMIFDILHHLLQHWWGCLPEISSLYLSWNAPSLPLLLLIIQWNQENIPDSWEESAWLLTDSTTLMKLCLLDICFSTSPKIVILFHFFCLSIEEP